jgi:hypothetical protein
MEYAVVQGREREGEWEGGRDYAGKTGVIASGTGQQERLLTMCVCVQPTLTSESASVAVVTPRKSTRSARLLPRASYVPPSLRK